MISNVSIKDIDVLVLCGGKGKRLKALISDRPKPMAEVNKKPFLDILIEYVAGFGFRRFVLCTGYMADYIEAYYKNKPSGLDILFSAEKEPLGTAGGIKNAESLLKSNPFLALNGDSICRVDLKKFLDFHINKKALSSIALANINDASDYGRVSIDKENRVLNFIEKQGSGRDYVNAGVYFLDRSILSLIRKNEKTSLEKDVFPVMAKSGRSFGFVTNEKLFDIGTPDRFNSICRAEISGVRHGK